MIGDPTDIAARIKAVLPARWFPDATPVLDSLLAGLSDTWSWAYGLVQYVAAQTRIATATGAWLDVIADDLFGSRVARAANQTDESLRAAIAREVVRTRGTRAAIVAALTDLTGRAPTVFEPARPTDTGVWAGATSSAGGVGYGLAGGWGNLTMPFQSLVVARRPANTGIAAVGGWGGPAGWGAQSGPLEYGNLAMFSAGVTDAQIFATVADVIPAASIAWTRITN